MMCGTAVIQLGFTSDVITTVNDLVLQGADSKYRQHTSVRPVCFRIGLRTPSKINK